MVGKEQPLGQDVPALAPIELELDRPAERLLVDVPEDVGGLGRASQGGQCLGDAIGRAGVVQALHDDMGRGEAIFERSGDADELYQRPQRKTRCLKFWLHWGNFCDSLCLGD